ncbi:ribonuclease P protein component [Mycobacterium shigaense]|uniref:ribonuclease P protein component n=1 Tax=Mycobacterium shigaense TaxID=722731 RepID=UPI000E5932B7|nr:ribonuclease P protein component [Mycobacterium shigaense]MEA1121496.1 ribonuclease P protein component [Mycobacterium shigaense]
MLPARNRMRRSTEFDSTVKRGLRTAQPDVVVHVHRSSDSDEDDGPRVGLIVGKAVGSAVQRHRVSRRLRHAVRAMLPDLDPSDRVVLRALPGSRSVSSARLQKQVRTGLRRATEHAKTRR